MSSMSTDSGFLGATLVVVGTGLSQTQLINPARAQNGGFFKIHSGAGTLAILPFLGASFSMGYPVGATEVISFEGPAGFYLGAATATMTVALVQSFSKGASLFP